MKRSSYAQSIITVRARVLGRRLRELRERRKISGRGLSLRLGLPHSSVSFWETGQRPPSTEDVAALLAALHVTGEERRKILDLARKASEPTWVLTGLPDAPDQAIGVMECERAATRIVNWSPLVIPGLLQTTAYTRAILNSGGLSPQEQDARMVIRMARREILERPHPTPFRTLISANAVQEAIGGAECMRGQVQHLLTCSRRTALDLQIVPPNVGWHPGLAGPFILFEFEDQDTVLYLEHHRTGIFTPDEDDVRDYKEAVAIMERLALSREDTRCFLETLI